MSEQEAYREWHGKIKQPVWGGFGKPPGTEAELQKCTWDFVGKTELEEDTPVRPSGPIG